MALVQWISHQEKVEHDDTDGAAFDQPPLDHNAPCEAVDELADPLRLGRTIETMLDTGLWGKLNRFEVDLSNRLRRLLGDLNAMRVARAQVNAGRPQFDRFDHLTDDGKLKPP